MKNLYGICQHSPSQVYDMLAKHYEIRMLGFDKRLEKPTSKRVIFLCPTVALFTANRDILNKCKQASVIVFDTAVKAEFLKPIELLDVESRKITYIYKFKTINPVVLRRKLEQDHEIVVDEKVVQVIPRLLKQTHDSFIAMIMNFIYGIPNSESREQVKIMVFRHLSEGQTTELADKLEQQYKRSKLVKGFINLLREGKADSFAAALHEMTAGMKTKKAMKAEDAEAKLKATNYKKLSKAHGISKFDLTYSAKYVAKVLSQGAH